MNTYPFDDILLDPLLRTQAVQVYDTLNEGINQRVGALKSEIALKVATAAERADAVFRREYETILQDAANELQKIAKRLDEIKGSVTDATLNSLCADLESVIKQHQAAIEGARSVLTECARNTKKLILNELHASL